MRHLSVYTGIVLSFLAFNSWASSPKVVADIAPLHSLVTQVMAGVGKPELLVQPEASPHRYSLRPSDARSLSEADLVFWISEDLTPWLEGSLESLSPDARKVALMEQPETLRHRFREGATFEAHHHDDNEPHNDERHHDEQEHHDEQAHHEAGDHEGKSEDHHDHHHGVYDPHAWLDPVNAKVWADIIARELSGVDPDHREQYLANAAKLKASLDQLIEELTVRAEKLGTINFIVFHDAYQYFERRFNLVAAGAISLSDATDPGPARIREIQNRVAALNVSCAFTEPQYNPRMLDTIFGDTEVKTLGVMDPLGVDINDASGHYTKLLRRLMTSLEQCR